MATVQKCVVKGHLFGAVQTRAVFYGNVELESPDTVDDPWMAYLNPIYTAVNPFLGSAVVTETFEIFDQSGSTWYSRGEFAFSTGGGSAGEQLANAVAAVLIGRVPSHHGVGRKFFSGLAETAVSGNALITSALSAFAAACVLYVSPITTANGSSLAPGIVDKNDAFHMFLGGFVSALLGSQRRRKPGIGV